MIIPLTGRHGAGKFALINSDDAPLVEGFSWFIALIKNIPYVVASVRTQRREQGEVSAREWRQIRLSRLVMGVSDPKTFVNFKDQNPLNCRKSNLRIATPAQSTRTRGILGSSRNRYKGVYQVGGYFGARISVNRRCNRLGVFDTEEQAAAAYDDAARELHGVFARPNFASPAPLPARHKHHARYITAQGKTMTISGWARESGVSRATISRRLRHYV